MYDVVLYSLSFCWSLDHLGTIVFGVLHDR